MNQSNIEATNSYMVSVQEVDRHAEVDPQHIMQKSAEEQNSQFKPSHPSVYMPRHKYRKYKMKTGANRTGLNIINEKPVATSNFAIVHVINRDLKKAQDLRDAEKH